MRAVSPATVAGWRTGAPDITFAAFDTSSGFQAVGRHDSVRRANVGSGPADRPPVERILAVLRQQTGTAAADLIESLRRRDPAVLQQVVQDNARKLYRAARGMGLSSDRADDLTQEVFVTIDEAFQARFDAAGNWIQPLAAPDRLTASAQMGESLRACLADLPPLQRDVFQLRQVEELSAAAVGAMLGRTVTHVGVLLHRARLRLQQCLEKKGWSPAS